MGRRHGGDHSHSAEDQAPGLVEVSSFGEDTGRGNLLGIQPYMIPTDYASEQRFHAKLQGYLQRSQEEGFVGDRTVVVFPEYLGVWLVLAGEKASVYKASTVSGAALAMAMGNPLSFLRRLPFVGGPERARRALFHMKAKSMAAIYHRVFSRLAGEHRVSLVAGSVFLPHPSVRDGSVVCGRGSLQNVTVVYGPDGRAMAPIVRKAFPVEEEIRYLRAGAVEEIPVFETAAGLLGVLICADSWHPESYQALRGKGVEIVAVPCYLASDGRWSRPWVGYDSAPSPADCDPHDEGRLTEAEAWMKYALPGRIATSGARAGISVFLRGDLWDLGSDGQTLAVLAGKTWTGPHVEGAALVNLWLGEP